MNYNGTEYYYLRNGQNDIVGIMDGSGTKVVEYTYDSWGKPLTVTGTLATTLGANNPFRYRGYYYDTETGLYYLQTRYYDPEVCRFISADVYLSTGQGIVGSNMYAYCNNNPANMTDPSGHLPQWIKTISKAISDGVKRIITAIRKVINSVTLPKAVGAVKASSHDLNRRPNTGEPGSTYKSPNGDSRTYGPDGYPEEDYDHDDHDQPSKHPHDEKGGHTHKWENGKRGPAKSVFENPLLGFTLVTICAIGAILIIADDVTGIGAADDFLLTPISAGFEFGIAMIVG